MKPCDEMSVELLADFAFGRLGEDRAEEVRRHLEGCPSCRDTVDRLTRLREAMHRCDRLAEPEVRPADREAILERVGRSSDAEAVGPSRRPHRRFYRRAFWRSAAMAAAVVLVLALGVMLGGPGKRGAEIARIRDATGRVSVGGETISSGAKLHVSQQVRTGSRSRLKLSLGRGGELELNENTALRFLAGSDEGTVCRLTQGEVFVSHASDRGGRRFEVRTSAGRAQTTGGTFDLRVRPQGLAAGWLTGGIPLALAAEGVDVLGDVGPDVEVRLTVLRGNVRFVPSGDARPRDLRRGQQLCYDTARRRTRVREVVPEQHVLWRLEAARLVDLARRHAAEVFGAQRATLTGRRLRLEYEFLTERELADWATRGGPWRLDRDALRATPSTGQEAFIESRPVFTGDVEVSLEATVDPRGESSLWWALRPAGPSEEESLFRAKVTTNSGPAGRTRLSLDAGDRSVTEVAESSPGSVFRFGGRVEEGTGHVTLQGHDVLVRRLPERVARKLYGPEQGRPVRVVVGTGGPDVFLRRIALSGRVDVDWLRDALGRAFERPEDVPR